MAPIFKITHLFGLTPLLLAISSTASPLLPQHFGKSGGAGEEKNATRASSAVELQLESLKGRHESADANEKFTPAGTNQTLLKSKSPLNLEKAQVSDNSQPEPIWADNESLNKRDFQLPRQYQYPVSSLKYTPHDIGEYVFWTGDENGVALALAELVENEMMSEEDAIVFLELVKKELEELEARYEHHRRKGGQKPTGISAELKGNDIKGTGFQSLKSNMEPKYGGLKSVEQISEATPKDYDIWSDYNEILESTDRYDKDKESLGKGIRHLATEFFSKGAKENPQLALHRLAKFVDKLAKV